MDVLTMAHLSITVTSTGRIQNMNNNTHSISNAEINKTHEDFKATWFPNVAVIDLCGNIFNYILNKEFKNEYKNVTKIKKNTNHLRENTKRSWKFPYNRILNWNVTKESINGRK